MSTHKDRWIYGGKWAPYGSFVHHMALTALPPFSLHWLGNFLAYAYFSCFVLDHIDNVRCLAKEQNESICFTGGICNPFGRSTNFGLTSTPGKLVFLRKAFASSVLRSPIITKVWVFGDVLMCWCTICADVLMYWCADVLGCWCGL